MKFVIGADLVPTKSNYNDFIKGNIQNIIDSNFDNKQQIQECKNQENINKIIENI